MVKFSWSPARKPLLIVTVAPVKVALPLSVTVSPVSITVGGLPWVQYTVLPAFPRTGAVLVMVVTSMVLVTGAEVAVPLAAVQLTVRVGSAPEFVRLALVEL